MFDGGDGVQYELGPLRLDPARRTLSAGDAPVAIHGRAFDLLVFLVENRDRFVCRDAILAHVWAGTVVSDGNIPVQVAALRRILAAYGIDGAAAITNVSGRGYRFTGAVSVLRPAAPPVGGTAAPAARPTRRKGAVAAFLVAVVLAIPPF